MLKQLEKHCISRVYKNGGVEWGPELHSAAIFSSFLPTSRSSSKDAIESSLLRTLHWTWCAWDSDCVATSGFFLYISIIIRSRLYGIKMQHPVVELKLLTRESWRMKNKLISFPAFQRNRVVCIWILSLCIFALTN